MTSVDVDHLQRVLSPKQLQAIAFCPRRKITLLEGSVSAGKTLASLWALLIGIRNAPRNGLIVVVGKTLQTAYDNVFVLLQSPEIFGELAGQVHYTRGAPAARILGRDVVVVGANDAKSEEKIRGKTVALAYVDEATLLPKGFWPMLVTRLRVPGARLIATTNPGPRNHWLRKDWILRPDETEMQTFSFRMRDNPSLTESYIASMERSFTGVFYDRFILGKWTNAEGAVFDLFDPTIHVVPWVNVPRLHRIPGVGVDYGTQNASTALALGWADDGRLYLVDEWRHDTRVGQATWTDAQLSAGVRAWLPGPHSPHPAEPDAEWVFVDPAAASFKTQLYYDGQRNVANADNDVLTGIRTVASLLAQRKLLISDRCEGLIDELPGYTWDSKAADRGEDKPVKENDHCLAAGTLVETKHGRRPIEDVQEGERVWTRQGLRRVTRAWQSSPSAEVVRLSMSNGQTLTGTADHRVWAVGRGWITMDALRYGDKLLAWPTATRGPRSAPAVVVLGVSGPLGKHPVYDLTVDGAHEFFAAGVLVHNSIDGGRYAVQSTRDIWARELLGVA